MNLEPISFTEYLNKVWKQILTPLLTVTAWFTIKFAIKAYVIMLLYNLVVPVLFTNAPILLYGHAFAITALITILLSDLDSYTKANNQILININNTLWQLITNQIKQNNGMLSYLKDLNYKIDNNVPKVEYPVDSDSNSNYNTKESENPE